MPGIDLTQPVQTGAELYSGDQIVVDAGDVPFVVAELGAAGTAVRVLDEIHALDLVLVGLSDVADVTERYARGAGPVAAHREDALRAARRSLTLDPYRDTAWKLVIDLHEGSGDYAAAQAVRLRHRKVLAELGLDGD